jgi:hypothetical protein
MNNISENIIELEISHLQLLEKFYKISFKSPIDNTNLKDLIKDSRNYYKIQLFKRWIKNNISKRILSKINDKKPLNIDYTNGSWKEYFKENWKHDTNGSLIRME